jgi:hypothetical protein
MPNTLTFWQGNRDPAIAETLTIGGVPKNLTGCTVKFKMRAPGSLSAFKIDAAATIVSAAVGTVQYPWQLVDVADALGAYLAWWEVTTTATGNKQDMNEVLIQFLAHAPVSRDYVELEEFKKTIALDGLSFADLDVKKVLSAAARKVDEIADRRFYADADALQVRYYSPDNAWTLHVDDIVTVTSLKTDDGGDGTFENTWTLNTDYTREPLNAAADGKPWEKLCVHPSSSFYFPVSYPRSVELTGKFGWASVPQPISIATTMLAHRYLKRVRESPTGVAGFGLDGAVVRFMSVDSDVMDLVGDYSRKVLVA